MSGRHDSKVTDRFKDRSLLGSMALAAALAVLAAAAAAGGIVLLELGKPNDASAEIGKWLLQLATVFLGTGVVGVMLRQVDLSRAKRESWTRLLQEVVAAHDTVQLAGRLLSAHATAKTYAEQIAKVSEVREILRRIMSSPEIHDEPELRDTLLRMRHYLKRLVKEYEAKYLPVSRQQRLDEEVLTYRLKELARKADDLSLPIIPESLASPFPAGSTLGDPERFPCLNEFRTNYKQSDFRLAYEMAKPILEHKAGIRRPFTMSTKAIFSGLEHDAVTRADR